jgi:serine/threonine-protein kinase PRP4
MGLVPAFTIDLWSVAVSVAELFLGDVVFRGKTNNDMMYCFMQHLGPFSNRLIRQHLVQCQKMPVTPQFTQRQEGAGSDYLFVQHTEDPVTGKPVNKYVSLFSSSSNSGIGGGEVFPSIPLSKKILKAKSAKDSRTQVLRFSDLLQKCLALDPSRRISLKDALQHDFFTKNVAASANGGSAAATS